MKQKLRKISSLLLALLMLAATAAVFTPAISAATDTWNGTDASDSLSGEGTKDSPYLVQSAADLAYIAKAASNEGDEDFVGKFFKQTVDIDLAGHHWTPIGDTKNAFKGSYDGDGHTVSGLSCDMMANSITDKEDQNYDADDKNYAGLFGRVSGDYDNAEYITIENLTVRGTLVRSLLCAGGVAAAAKNLVRIVNCHTEITQLDGAACGGIVGRINFEGFSGDDKNYIVACTSKSKIFNEMNIPRNTKENGSYDKDNISTGRSYTYVGGIAGIAQNVTIAYCTNNGLLDILPLPNSAYQSWVGGIVGVAGTSGAPQTTDIYFCTNNGLVKTYKSYDASSIVEATGVVFEYTNKMRIGGIAGKLTNNNNNNTVAGCVNTVMPAVYTSNSASATTVASNDNQSFAGIAGFCNYAYVATSNFSVGDEYVAVDNVAGDIATTKLEADGANGAAGMALDRSQGVEAFTEMAISHAVSKSYYTKREIREMQEQLAAQQGVDSVDIKDYLATKVSLTDEQKTALAGIWQQGEGTPTVASVENAMTATLTFADVINKVDAELRVLADGIGDDDGGEGDGSTIGDGNTQNPTGGNNQADTTAAADTTAPAEKKGCGSFVAVAPMVLGVGVVAAVACARRKKED